MIGRFLTLLILFAMTLCVSSVPVPVAAAHVVSSISLPQYTCSAPSEPPITATGSTFVRQGQPLVFRGFTMYPNPGGTGLWTSPSFSAYARSTMNLGRSVGQNLVRPTDEWTQHGAGQSVSSSQLWKNLDGVVCEAQRDRIYVVLDVSAYKWLLISTGQDPMNASLWLPFLRAVGHHYAGVSSIAFYSIVGEPQFPRTAAQVTSLVAYYRTLTDALSADDTTHLISAGGFNNMNNGVPGWWKGIYALPHNDVDGYKTYSQHDLDLMPSILAFTTHQPKPAVDEEFGEPQSVGDGTFSGSPYNGLSMSRAQFYTDVYSEADRGGAVATIFWNLACVLGPPHYDVSPMTPSVWAVIMAHRAQTPVPDPSACV